MGDNGWLAIWSQVAAGEALGWLVVTMGSPNVEPTLPQDKLWLSSILGCQQAKSPLGSEGIGW